MLQQMLGVVTVLALLAGTLWWLRRRGIASVVTLARRGQSDIVQHVQRLPLSPTHSLHLIRVSGRAILLACSPSGCQLLESAPWSDYDSGSAR